MNKISSVRPGSLCTMLKFRPWKCLREQIKAQSCRTAFSLGTGSALPSIHRNVLSNLVRIPYKDEETHEIRFRALLLDGGENTIGTLMRNFGHDSLKQLKQIFSELRLIYLSHLHADHHLGIISVISAWAEANKNNTDKLYLVIPWQYNNFITEWYRLEQYTSNCLPQLRRFHADSRGSAQTVYPR